MFNTVLSQNVSSYLLLGLLCFLLTGCGISKRTTAPHPPQERSISQDEPSVQTETEQDIPVAMDVSSAYENITSVQKQLHNAHREWKGTPYRFGGETSNGIDCSAFTQQVFRDFFNKDLPRHTRKQLREGTGIRRRSIKTGDLIFFKTGRRSLHVGISMGDGDFLHASVTSGVMISNIGESYWATRFLGARRVL
ncbi:MAG: hydrolase Nlp/P60 [Bacteroidetes bacterium]|jgi:cell wall-associated NlpC family hydrolase|nr:hydrolase Nlp/P60 [Bacteroidota bacterium]